MLFKGNNNSIKGADMYINLSPIGSLCGLNKIRYEKNGFPHDYV